jgi:aquaporin Z
MSGNRYLAEGMGTFALVLTGCGAIAVNDLHGGPLGHLGICMVFGLVVMAMIYAVGNISGAHLNPAVSLGFVFAGRLKIGDAIGYIGAQFAGAIIAASLLRYLLPESDTLGTTAIHASLTMDRAFVLEAVLSFLLMFVILNVSSGHMEKGIMAGVAVGGTIALEALIGGPLTGASMNPARSLGPALISGHLESIWLYLLAPVVGTLLASPTCRWIQGAECCASSNSSG